MKRSSDRFTQVPNLQRCQSNESFQHTFELFRCLRNLLSTTSQPNSRAFISAALVALHKGHFGDGYAGNVVKSKAKLSFYSLWDTKVSYSTLILEFPE